MAKKDTSPKSIESIRHTEDKRKNIPSAEHESVLDREQAAPVAVRYPRNTDLDPQLVWRGKDAQDGGDLVVQAPPLYIQEKIHPKALIEDLKRESEAGKPKAQQEQLSLFGDFNGIPEEADKTEFYQHDQNWTNRMVLGDSLQVMASLAEKEGLRGKVQCIYFDPPYGIKFNSNFQWSTTSRDVKDGNSSHITREPEQVKAFRDTWRDGIHSYLTYLRDRLMVMRDLLTDSGSIFVQIGDENVHRVRAVMDEVFGEENYVAEIGYHSTSGSTSDFLSNPKNYLLWFAKKREHGKFNKLMVERSFSIDDPGPWQIVEKDYVRTRLSDFLSLGGQVSDRSVRIIRMGDATSQRQGREAGDHSAMGFPFRFQGQTYRPSGTRGWSTTEPGMVRAGKAGRLFGGGKSLSLIRYFDESPYFPLNSSWEDTGGTIGAEKVYVVQTNVKVIQRCILMATDPGDLVLDPTCGSGTTAYVAEQWGRRWITIDTSRVALALARARIMGARYLFYLLTDSKEGKQKEAEVTRTQPKTQATQGNIRHGFVYERVPHITLKSIANNAEIDVIWEKWQQKLEPLREELNRLAGKKWEEWEIPRDADAKWAEPIQKVHAEWWKARIARQQEIDKSIAAKAEFEYLYDRPYPDPKRVRVAGPFTVESTSRHRMLEVGASGELIDPQEREAVRAATAGTQSFTQMILDNLKKAGVQQMDKGDRIRFEELQAWPGDSICAEGRYLEGEVERRAGIFIGPEFGTVGRADLVDAAREAADAGFDVLIACAFNYEAHSSDFKKLGRIPVLKARMNSDLHMAGDLKSTTTGNLFVVFGEPDIVLHTDDDGRLRVEVKGVDVFDPSSGEIRSDGPDGIACWFIDTDYNGESFFVRHAYFLGQADPYGSLKTTLKAEINAEVWETLRSAVSRPFEKPASGRIAVKVINHLGDEVMKVFRG